MQNFKSTLDSLKQIFKAFGRKLSLGALHLAIRENNSNTCITPVTVKLVLCTRPMDCDHCLLKNHTISLAFKTFSYTE